MRVRRRFIYERVCDVVVVARVIKAPLTLHRRVAFEQGGYSKVLLVALRHLRKLR
jgi:hypothetical protein